jgi:hypothetical protein
MWWVGPVAVAVITIGSSFWTFDLVERWVIKSAYGEAAWDGGLRVADNKGHLSDGRELTSSQSVAVYFGSYLLSVPFFLGSAIGLSYVNMRLHGEKFRDSRDSTAAARRAP